MENDSENRRSGILLDEDFNVYADQKETEDELSKAALAGLLYFFDSKSTKCNLC